MAAESGQHVGDAQHQVLPGVSHRVFEIEHYAGRAGIEHFYDELAVVGGAGHLVALILAPGWELDAPVFLCCCGRRQVIRQMASKGCFQGLIALFNQGALPGRKLFMEGNKELDESFRQILGGIEAGRGRVRGHDRFGSRSGF